MQLLSIEALETVHDVLEDVRDEVRDGGGGVGVDWGRGKQRDKHRSVERMQAL